MIGIFVQLAISWLLLWLFQKKHLSVLGFNPSKQRIKAFAIFFSLAIVCAIAGFLQKMAIAHFRYEVNPNLEASVILEGIWYTIKAVLYEELIFRGAIFYILLCHLPVNWAIGISATAFGIYHWFSHELWGRPQQMIIEFLATGAMGLVLAYGFVKARSLYIPVAIHLGWNLGVMVIFSGDTIGPQLITEVLPRNEVTVSYFSFYMMLFLPFLVFLILTGWLLKRYKHVGSKEKW